MSNKLKKGKQINAVLVGLFCLLFLVACSELNSILKSKPLDEQDAARFVSKIRPYQEDKESIYRRACYFQERRKHKLAVLEFHRVTQIDPTHAKAFNGMGVSYDHMGQFDLALECYHKALAINPDLDYVQNNLGYSFLLQEDVDNAIATFKKAITLNGENKRYHNNLGLAYAEKGLHDLAFQEFKLAGGSLKAREDIEKEGADFLRRGLGAETGTDRESPGNAVRIGALESYSSMEQTPSVNNGRAQTSAYPFAVDNWIPTLEKIEKEGDTPC